MSEGQTKSKYELQNEAVAKRNKLMKEYADKRDPIHYHTYNEIVKIRKWIAFIGIIVIISLIGAILAFLGL